MEAVAQQIKIDIIIFLNYLNLNKKGEKRFYLYIKTASLKIIMEMKDLKFYII